MKNPFAPNALRVPDRPAPGAVVMAAVDVSLTLGETKVLDNVDLEVRAGQVLALIGPNGAGKSSLLGVMCGDLQPEAGSVIVDGAPLLSWGPLDLAVRRGVLLQRVDVSFPFSVTQVVRMGRAPWEGTPAEDWDDEIVAASLVETDVAMHATRIFTSLSGGERARAALARVLAQEPCALLLDEPTAALDIRHQELMLRLARARAARGDAVVVVMHDLGLAAAHSDVVCLLSRGQVRAAGPPAAVLTPALLSAVYEYPIEVLLHPRTGSIVIIPEREAPGSAGTALLNDLVWSDSR